jgi:hypothetical protein
MEAYAEDVRSKERAQVPDAEAEAVASAEHAQLLGDADESRELLRAAGPSAAMRDPAEGPPMTEREEDAQTVHASDDSAASGRGRIAGPDDKAPTDSARRERQIEHGPEAEQAARMRETEESEDAKKAA